MEGSLTPSSTASRIVDGDQSDLPLRPNVLDCFICMEPPIDPVATSCGHVFCWPCMYRWLQNRPKPCPVCRNTLRKDVNLIPLYGAGCGAGAGQNNGSESAGESIPVSDNDIPLRPRNPLLVTSTANTEGSGHEHSSPIYSVLSAYERSMFELSNALVNAREQVRVLSRDRGELVVMVNLWKERNAGLVREMQDRDWQIFLERSRRLQVVSQLEQRNLMLVREAQQSRERELQCIEMGNRLGVHIEQLEMRLKRANCLLEPGSSDVL